ncbi:cupin domain-containing protein [Halopseudomonas maritima]|uniref:cupin domain-containing protein n=1 Tax=Halopseudomonas maritima TaxID=2918528 RepID=UPI001EEADB2C|nr:cupin domain-containing protein [Halopseudomonas maritima]UJJ30012.1 cupin domain-containing protein [Halopseudomonas maritima]
MPEFQPLRMARAAPCRVGPQDQSWLAAPQAPIRRWPLEREAPESGQVTSLVEYLPGARFPAHCHPAGEEILVLDGVFSDQSGDFPAGSYLRSPAGSSHAPFSQPGCVIFVKLNQLAAEDRQTLRLLPGAVSSQAFAPDITGQLLHEHGPEQTWLLNCAVGARLVWAGAPAAELLVLSGGLQEGEVRAGALSWFRDPALGRLGLLAAAPTRVLLKIGALRGL